MGEAKQVGTIATGERQRRAGLAAEHESRGESRRVGRNASARRERSVQRTPDEIGQVIHHDPRVATTLLERGEDREPDRRVAVERCG